MILELLPLIITTLIMSGSRAVVQVLRQIVEKRLNETGFEKVLKNIRVVDGSEGRCVCELPVTPDIANPRGTLHGGVTATLVDAVSTWAVMTTGEKRPGISIDLRVSYMKGAKIGESVLIEAQTLKVGKTLAFLSVDVKNKECGSLLAQGTHTKFMPV